MADPTRYDRDYSFAGFQANAPQTPLPGQKVDIELSNIETSLNSTIDGLLDIRRSDGRLKNGIVTPDALSPEIATGVAPAVAWTAAAFYDVNASVFFGTGFYRALAAHVSGSDFADDLSAGRWDLYADFGIIVVDAEAARDLAATSAAAAVVSASAAATSASAAAGSQSAAAGSASTATSAAATATSAAATASGAATTATSQAALATAAAVSAAASFEAFDDVYLGAKTTQPTVDNDGNPLQPGMLYTKISSADPIDDGLYLYVAGAWQKGGSSINGLIVYRLYSSANGNLTAGQTVFTVAGGYDANSAVVVKNGSELINGVEVNVSSGTTFTLTSPVLVTDNIVFKGFGAFQAANVQALDVGYSGGSGLLAANAQAAIVELALAGAGLLGNAGVSVGAPASGAITISLTDAAGNAPSAISPVSLPFRSATEASGVSVVRKVSAAQTLTLSSGSTLGVPAINTPFSLWLVEFDDAGTLRMGVINCLSGTSIYPLGSVLTAGSTAEGGAGAADSAHTFYSAVAVTGKAFCILARLTWSSGLAALGTWTQPSRIEVWRPGMKLPSEVVQIAHDAYTANADLTAIIPFDDTIPQNTEGTQVQSLSITPTSAANILLRRWQGQVSLSPATYCAAAMFEGASDAVRASFIFPGAGGGADQPELELRSLAGAVTARTVSVRVGPTSTSTARLNGAFNGRIWGGASAANLTVEEIVA